jgi:hypothetical protein
MPVAFAVYSLFTTYAVYTMATIMAITASVAMSAQNASKARDAQRQATEDYYRQLQKGKIESNAFKTSQASYKSTKMQAQKYSLISEQMQMEAQARETFKGTRQQTGYRPRTDEQRLRDFQMFHSAKSISMLEENKVLEEQDLFKPYNFGIENFNVNYFGEENLYVGINS